MHVQTGTQVPATQFPWVADKVRSTRVLKGNRDYSFPSHPQGGPVITFVVQSP